jgi:hypothetical protein
MNTVELIWDYKEPAPMQEIAEAVHRLSTGTIMIEEVDEGLDSYMIRISATTTSKTNTTTQPDPQIKNLKERINQLEAELMCANAARARRPDIAVELRRLAEQIDMS